MAGSIILHHFGVWAKYPERARDTGAEAKFKVDPLPDPKTVPLTAEQLAVRAERKRRRELRQKQAEEQAKKARVDQEQ